MFPKPRAILTLSVVMLALQPLTALGADPLRRLGPRLDDSDWALVRSAAEKLYLPDAAEEGTAEAWRNPETGSSGTVTLVGKHEYEGMPCRRLQHDIAVKGTSDHARFVVDRCKTADGEWKIVAP